MTTHPGGDPAKHRADADAKPRNVAGRFIPTLTTAERNAEACRLRTQGWTYRQIAERFGIDVHTAWDAVRTALRETQQEAADDVRRLELGRLDAELERLNDLDRAARKVLDRHHVTVANNGTIVHHNNEPLLDDAPVLQAVDRLLRIEEARRKNGESRRKLLGLDAPSRVSVEAEQLGRDILRLLDDTLGSDGDGGDADA